MSKLQTEIATSMLEAEYVLLGHCCRALFPLLWTVRCIAEEVEINQKDLAGMHVKLHEDNDGVLTLAKLEHPRMMPHTEWYAMKYHWFQTQIEPNGVELVKILT